MTDSRIKTLLDRGNKLFADKRVVDSLNQEIALNFYPMRADFTTALPAGQDFASQLYSSYPVLVQRELSDAIGGMLRPENLEWFEISVEDPDGLSLEAKAWLQWATGLQRRAMYDRTTQLARSTKQGDRDFSAFGGAVISADVDWRESRLLFRTWHLRDVAWGEDYSGAIGQVHRKWKPHASDLQKWFPGSLHPKVEKAASKSPLQKIECRCISVKTEDFEPAAGKRKPMQPWTRLYIDVENMHVMEEKGAWRSGYVIPRWVTPSNSQYPYSPAAIAGLPEARLVQAMTLTLLEAGEMAVRPALLATRDAIREDINFYPGGITWTEAEYDERKGEVLRPVTQDKSGLPFGLEIAQDSRQILASAFYLNKLQLPPPQNGMTATEIGQRVQEYIRQALPLFEPLESDYNGALCEDVFDALLRAGAFGPPQSIPADLQGRKVQFKFKSPLHDALERKKGITFMEVQNLIAQAVQLDQEAGLIVDAREAVRDAIEGIGAPERWLRSEDAVDRMAAAIQQQQAISATAKQVLEGSQAAQSLGEAAKSLQGAQEASAA